MNRTSPRSTITGTAHGTAEGWYHVVQRGIGRRPIVTGAVDMNSLGQLLQREAHRGALEVHACSVLTNHLHLLVHGTASELSAGLRRVFAVYARRINRRLHRGGSLFQGRCRIRRIRSAGHWRATVAYIDRNAVQAGLARVPSHYRFGSAWHYARSGGPTWLHRSAIEEFVRRVAGRETFRPQDYDQAFGSAVSPGSDAVVERRLTGPEATVDPLDDLLAAASAGVRRWLEMMAQRADGLAAGPKLVDACTLVAALSEERGRAGPWPLQRGRPGNCATAARRQRSHGGGKRRDGWTVLTVGLLRAACGMSLEEVGGLVGLSVAGVHGQLRCHRDLMISDATYKARADRILHAALHRDHPDGSADDRWRAAPGPK